MSIETDNIKMLVLEQARIYAQIHVLQDMKHWVQESSNIRDVILQIQDLVSRKEIKALQLHSEIMQFLSGCRYGGQS